MQRRTADLVDLYAHEGPFTSVYVPMSAAIEDARQQLDIRLRDAQRSVTAAGGDPDLLERAELTPSDHQSGGALALLGVGPEPVLVRPLAAVRPELARVDRLPVVAPLLEDDQERVDHVVVLVDRTGAEIVTTVDGDEAQAEVSGDTEHLSRIRGGGWSHRRMQQRAENTWEHNAELVAGEVAEAAERSGARLIFAAGDERALGFLTDHLPDAAREILHVEPREPQGLADAFGAIEEALEAQMDTVVARDGAQLLQRFAEARGRGEAADGAEATLRALNESRVEVLLVHDDLGEGPRAWFAPDEALAATSRDSLEDLDRRAVEGRLHDIAIRAALLTDAEVRIVPGAGPNAPAAGLGALLRWN